MKQTTLCVPLEVRPESHSRLSSIVEEFRTEEDMGAGQADHFSRLKEGIPTLHFMSMSVFTSSEYDPLFILEANFDSEPGVFWGQLDALYRDNLREMLRCCKKPLNEDGDLYDSVTAADSRASVAPYFEARTQWPSVFHHGNRGMTRDRVLREGELFLAARAILDRPVARDPNGAIRDDARPDAYRGASEVEIHRMLRAEMMKTHSWLDTPSEVRIPLSQRVGDVARLLAFVVLLLLTLSLPGIVLAFFMRPIDYALLMLLAMALMLGLIYRFREPLPNTAVPTDFRLVGFLLARVWLIVPFLMLTLVLIALLLTLVLLPSVMGFAYLLRAIDPSRIVDVDQMFWHMARTVSLGLLSLIVVLPGIVLWLRFLERRDSSLDAPVVDERILRDMIRREDWVAQNHMGSVVMIRPGVLRTIIIRAGHLGLGLLLRVAARDGYLGSMRTVHFAHWAYLNNGGRLLFFSNFDHSWDSYLDDFIEKAHVGLTLAWGCGVGFPPTRFLIYDGASHGRRFKNWALASRAVSRFWYSAYPTLTVDQIERNNRLADGLRKPKLSMEEARKWIRDL